MMIETNSPEETYAFGKKLGMEAQAGQVYCLNGDLGVGKTVFTQGFAAGLGIQEPVNSPTFTIVQEYDDGRLPLYHFDVGLFLRRGYLPDRMVGAHPRDPAGTSDPDHD